MAKLEAGRLKSPLTLRIKVFRMLIYNTLPQYIAATDRGIPSGSCNAGMCVFRVQKGKSKRRTTNFQRKDVAQWNSKLRSRNERV